ncbi:MAG: thioredoxin [Planctomycetes bacterium]|nr:thioredoxin [Planctomycetota bacterium]
MASSNVLMITDDTFEDEVIQSDQPVLVDFWAEWCMPCKMLAPTIDELADEYAGRAKVGKVDTDENRDVAVKFGISAIPTVMVFANGELVKRMVGMQTKKDLKKVLDDALAG